MANEELPYEVTPEALSAAMREGNAPFLLDCREPEEYAICSLPGATLVPMSELTTRLQELDPETPTVVYCHHGVRSLHVTVFLRRQGFTDVRSLAGGIDRWSLRIDPTVARY